MYTRLLQSTTRLHPRAWDFIQLMRLDKPIGIYLFGQARRNVSAQVTRTAA